MNDLKQYGNATRGTLVVVSDGESTCGDPCAAAREIADQGFDLDTITVGFQISDEGRKELECISDALGGRYLDIEKSDELRDTLDRLGRPQIDVKLEGPAEREVIADGDYVEIAATVTNAGEVEARDVIGQITFRANGIDVRQPVSRLGNLPPRATRRVVWRVRAGPSVAGRSFPFVVVGRSLNSSVAGEARGRLAVVGVTTAADAGEILKGPGRGIAILGDSFSSGEGADAYVKGTDTERNGCHRSLLTYLVPLFGADDVDVLACSGAITNDVTAPKAGQGSAEGGESEPAQVTQLDRLQRERGEVRAVVMTLGGDDAGFPVLANSCLLTRASCADKVFPGAPWNQITSLSTDDFLTRYIGSESEVSSGLNLAYLAVNRTLNGKGAVGRRGRAAPILVLGYPLPVPLQGRTCFPMGAFVVVRQTLLGPRLRTVYALTAAEIDFIVKFALRLNAAVESAVERVRREDGVPIFYVPPTEFAFLPRHTVCDLGKAGSATEPFARSVASINGAGVHADTLWALGNPFGATSVRVLLGRLRAAKTIVERSVQEVAHPNVKGYGAETLTLLRWSRSRAAQSAVEHTRGAGAARPVATSWDSSQVNLGQIEPGQTPVLQGGTTYPLTRDGFAPNAPLRVVAESSPRLLAVVDADAAGRLDTRVALPRDLRGSHHTLKIVGADPRGRPLVVSVPFKIDQPFRPPLLVSMAVTSAGFLLIGLGIVAATGQLGRWRRRFRLIGRSA